MRQKNVISTQAPVQPERLRLLNLTYFDFEGKEKDGQLVVLDACAESVVSIFRELHARRFAISKMVPITEYDGDDDRSMADNNTSCHNFRPVAGSSRLSLHSYGTAIDLNPIQNPYVILRQEKATATYLPPASMAYANRRLVRIGKAYRAGMAEEVVDVFARHGFYDWGGNWDSPIDYQHFQVDREVSYLLAAMSPEEAHGFFLLQKSFFNEFGSPLEALLKQHSHGLSLSEKYAQDPDEFMSWVMAIQRIR